MSSSRIVQLRRGRGRGLALIVSGPSGAGKTTVINRVLASTSGLSYSISHTTRPPRAGEVDRVDYVFTTSEAFDRMVRNNEFVEHVTYLGAQYGTSRAEIRRRIQGGDDVVLNIDVQGAKSLQQAGLADVDLVYVFLAPSSLAILEDRLRERNTESDEAIAGRLEVAREELLAIPQFDYLVINDQLEAAVNELKAIIVSERARVLPHLRGSR